MGRSKVFGIRIRRENALDSLSNKKDFLENLKKKIPKRIIKEMEVLEYRINNYTKKNK
jgi:GTP-dependent phosphoenolpyruvate carboxykinase